MCSKTWARGTLRLKCDKYMNMITFVGTIHELSVEGKLNNIVYQVAF